MAATVTTVASESWLVAAAAATEARHRWRPSVRGRAAAAAAAAAGAREPRPLRRPAAWPRRPRRPTDILSRLLSVGGCGPRMFEIGTSVEHLGPASEICRTPQGRRLSLHCVGGHPSAARPVKPISEIRSKIQDRLPSRADAGQACRTKVGLTLTPVTDSGPRFRC